MTTAPRNIDDALATFDDTWSPHLLATVNDCDVRVVKVAGDFVWHSHEDTDELFVVLDGHLRIDLRDGPDGPGGAERHVDLGPRDTFVVPRGVEHCPSSLEGASLMLFEPSGTVSTGDYAGEVPDHITPVSTDLPPA